MGRPPLEGMWLYGHNESHQHGAMNFILQNWLKTKWKEQGGHFDCFRAVCGNLKTSVQLFRLSKTNCSMVT